MLTDNLKVAIGEKIYLRGDTDHFYHYQGRPSDADILAGDTIVFLKVGNVTATDANIIAASDFHFNDYTDGMEVFPLPDEKYLKRKVAKNRYFARATNDDGIIREALGPSGIEAQFKLALILAFDKIPTD